MWLAKESQDWWGGWDEAFVSKFSGQKGLLRRLKNRLREDQTNHFQKSSMNKKNVSRVVDFEESEAAGVMRPMKGN